MRKSRLAVALGLAMCANAHGQSANFGFDPYSSMSTSGEPAAVAIGDVIGDGLADLVAVNDSYGGGTQTNTVLVFAQRSDGTLAFPVAVPYNTTYGSGRGLVLADLDGDGVAEIVVGHGTGLAILYRDGAYGFRVADVPAGRDSNVLVSTDINRDGKVDVVGLTWSRGATQFFGDGYGGIARQAPLATNAEGYNDLDVGDLTGDGIDDLVVMSGQGFSPNLSVHQHDGFNDFLAPFTYRVGSNELTSGVAVGDFNGDGRKDVALSRARNSPNVLWLYVQDTNGNLQGPSTLDSYDVAETLSAGDLDGDGRTDLATLHGGWGRLGYYLQGDTGLQAEKLVTIPYTSHYPPQALAFGDLNGDGCKDAAIADSNGAVHVLHGHGCADITPEPILFSAQNGVPRSSWAISAPAIVIGIDVSAPISVVNGSYSIDGAAFTSAPGRIANGQSVRVAHMTSLEFATQVASALSVGTVSATFSSTTEARDDVPTAFSFADQTGVATGTMITSAPITVAGTNIPSSIGAAGGEYSVNGGAFTATGGMVNSGDQVRVRHVSATSAMMAVNTVLTIGGVSDTFTSTTGTADTTPNAFAFVDVTGARQRRVITSDPVIVSGITAATPIAVAGNGVRWSKNGGAFIATAGTVLNGDSIRLQVTSASTAYTKVDTQVTIGGIGDTWSVTTGNK